MATPDAPAPGTSQAVSTLGPKPADSFEEKLRRWFNPNSMKANCLNCHSFGIFCCVVWFIWSAILGFALGMLIVLDSTDPFILVFFAVNFAIGVFFMVLVPFGSIIGIILAKKCVNEGELSDEMYAYREAQTMRDVDGNVQITGWTTRWTSERKNFRAAKFSFKFFLISWPIVVVLTIISIIGFWIGIRIYFDSL